jgi:hypothetical protein
MEKKRVTKKQGICVTKTERYVVWSNIQGYRLQCEGQAAAPQVSPKRETDVDKAESIPCTVTDLLLIAMSTRTRRSVQDLTRWDELSASLL